MNRRAMRFVRAFFFFCAVSAQAIDEAELNSIDAFLVSYTGVAEPSFRQRIRRVYENKQSGLLNLAAVIVLFEKRGCAESLPGHSGRIVKTLVPFAALDAERLAARVGLLDYLAGTEATNQLMRVNHPALRANYEIRRHLRHRLSIRGVGAARSNDIVGALQDQMSRSSRLRADVVIPQLLAAYDVLPLRRERPCHFSTIVQPTHRESEALIATHAPQALPLFSPPDESCSKAVRDKSESKGFREKRN